jgi:hypothetical protein
VDAVRRDDLAHSRAALARFEAEMEALVARVRDATAALHPRVVAATAAREDPDRASRLPVNRQAVAADIVMTAVKLQSVGVNAAKFTEDAAAALHGDRRAAMRLRRAARAPLPVRRLRPPACRPVRRLVRVRPREHRSRSSRSSHGPPGRPSRDDDPPHDVIRAGGRR